MHARQDILFIPYDCPFVNFNEIFIAHSGAGVR